MKRTLKRFSAYIVTAALVIGSLNYYAGDAETVQASDEYVVVWEDNFEGNSLDRSIWNVEENGNGGGNQELQYYRDSTEKHRSQQRNIEDKRIAEKLWWKKLYIRKNQHNEQGRIQIWKDGSKNKASKFYRSMACILDAWRQL